jgi:hypothetical protein
MATSTPFEREAERLLHALRAAAVDVPDGWVRASDVRHQLHRRGELVAGASAQRVGAGVDAMLVNPELIERQATEGAVLYRERREVEG